MQARLWHQVYRGYAANLSPVSSVPYTLTHRTRLSWQIHGTNVSLIHKVRPYCRLIIASSPQDYLPSGWRLMNQRRPYSTNEEPSSKPIASNQKRSDSEPGQHEHEASNSHSHSLFGHSHSHGEEGHSHGAEKIIAVLEGQGAKTATGVLF